MRILIAPDKFKGTLSGGDAARAIASALDGHDVVELPIADGGEGTAAVLGEVLGGRRMAVRVKGPLGEPVDADFWMVADSEGGGGLAIMEMSSASGFALLEDSQRDPWRATTHGTGELLLAAREAGADRVVLGIGGSATNDGGSGMAQALGFQFLDAAGAEITEIPERLGKAADIFFDPGLDLPEITVACDVNNPLLGQNGATQVFGPQKGVKRDDIARHEERLSSFADLVSAEIGHDYREQPGAGAAGGLGFGLLSFCDATLQPGFELVAAEIGLAEAIDAADLVITGEGQMDVQSVMGKGPSGVAQMARRAGKAVFAFCGAAADLEALADHFDGVFPLVDGTTTVEEAMAKPAELLKNKVADRRPLLERSAQ